MSDLDKLIAAVEAGADWDEAKSTAAYHALPASGMFCGKWESPANLAFLAYNGSLDAALRLHEALLPGWDWLLNKRSNYAHVWERQDVGDADADAFSVDTPARAWLLAILRALKAKESGNG